MSADARICPSDEASPAVEFASIKEAYPYPHQLPMKHGGNAAVEPEKWALSSSQFVQFLTACQNVCTWSELSDHEDEYKRAGSVSGYQVDTSFVRPYTASTGCSVALLLNADPLKADVMIS